MQSAQQNIYNVSKLNNEIKRLLEGNFGRVWVNAEISNFVAASSGHWYFTLKDARSQIKCAMFKGRNRAVRFLPKNGQQIMVKANLSVYEPRGDYQLLVDVMDMAGDGLLQQQFEQLKCDLAAQGLFSSAAKQPLPDSVKRIGVITSPTGAAIHDILAVLKRRNPLVDVIIYPAQVQGQFAANQLINAINIANQRNEVDLLILTRGGGSLEDLWCFNDETLAHHIFHSRLPIISAVGHEIDVTISDFVADYRAPTPSAAAEIAVNSNEELSNRLVFLKQQLKHSVNHDLHQKNALLAQLSGRLMAQDPKYKLQQQTQYLDELSARFSQAMSYRLANNQRRLSALAQRLISHSPIASLKTQNEKFTQLNTRLNNAINQLLEKKHVAQLSLMRELNTVSPLATLERGYSITFDHKNKVIKDVNAVSEGQQITSHFHHGKVTSIITAIDSAS